MAKTSKKPHKLKGNLVARPYQPHVLAGLFGAVLVVYGVSAISYDLEQATLLFDYDPNGWKWGAGMIAFGGMLVGAALSKGAYVYKTSKSKKVAQ